jgi:hypothetical protein
VRTITMSAVEGVTGLDRALFTAIEERSRRRR